MYRAAEPQCTYDTCTEASAPWCFHLKGKANVAVMVLGERLTFILSTPSVSSLGSVSVFSSPLVQV